VDSLERSFPQSFAMTTSVPYVAWMCQRSSVLIDALRFANDWTARIDFTNTSTVRAQLEATTHSLKRAALSVSCCPPSVTLSQRKKNRTQQSATTRGERQP